MAVKDEGSEARLPNPLLPPFPFAFNLSQFQGFFPMSWLLASGGQGAGALTSISVLPMSIQG